MTIRLRRRKKRGLNLPTALGPSREMPDVKPMLRERARQRWAEEIERAHLIVADRSTGAVLLEEIIPDTVAALSAPTRPRSEGESK